MTQDPMIQDPNFARAVLAIDQGQPDTLRTLLSEHPDLVRQRCTQPDAGYFAGSTLLHYVAWNPFPSTRDLGLDTDDPEQMPRCMPEIVAVLIEAGADPMDRNHGGSDPIGLLLTGALASQAELTAPILEALLGGGATVELTPSAVHQALANYSPEGARALIARGVAMDLRMAAGLGDFAALRQLAAEQRPSREEMGLAALHAYVGGHTEVLDWLLEQDLDLDVTGVQNGTLLHRACADANLDLVARLTALGADHNNRDNPFRATPLDWADHASLEDVVQWISDNAAEHLDLFQAAAHGILTRALEILQAQPDALHQVENVWRLGPVQPLRLATLLRRHALVELLVEHGADAHHVGGDGRTALDDAQAHGDARLIELLGPPT